MQTIAVNIFNAANQLALNCDKMLLISFPWCPVPMGLEQLDFMGVMCGLVRCFYAFLPCSFALAQTITSLNTGVCRVKACGTHVFVPRCLLCFGRRTAHLPTLGDV